jgi:dGTPase
MLGLDDELTEAISLGHDIGHTPFGHVGERTLNQIMNNCVRLLFPATIFGESERGFKHNLQGVRIFSELHRIYPQLSGTNLTNFTLHGIANHSGMVYGICKNYNKTEQKCYKKDRVPCHNCGTTHVDFYDRYRDAMSVKGEGLPAWSFEADVVSYADEMSQRHHDVEDAYLMNILEPSDIISKIEECFVDCLSVQKKKKLHEIKLSRDFFGPLISQFLVNMYNSNLIDATRSRMIEFAKDVMVKHRKDFVSSYVAYESAVTKKIVGYSDEFAAADKCFHDFLRNTILNAHRAQRMDGKGSYLIEKIFKAYFTNPRQLHDSTIIAVYNRLKKRRDTTGAISKILLGEYRKEIASATSRSNTGFELVLMRAICDHIAGMTDNFVMEEYSRLYGDKPI